MTISREIRNIPLLLPCGNPTVKTSQRTNHSPQEAFRVTHPKVRTGCRVCKIRRVKCDEGKPACLRCTSTGRKCEGYAEMSSSLRTGTSQSQNSLAEAPGSLTLYVPSSDIPGDVTERRSFYYLRARAIHDISGYFESDFWDRLVLQIGHTEAPVRHALLALSAICETYNSHSVDQEGLPDFQVQQKLEFALQQYSKAVSLLATDLSTANSCLDVTLTSCLVFIWLEFMRDNYDAGLEHLKSGLKILQDFRKPDYSHGLQSQHIDASLISLFGRLEIQATVHGSPTSDFNAQGPFEHAKRPATIPTSIFSLEQAHNCLNNFSGAVYWFIRELHDPEFIETRMQYHPWPDPLSLEAIRCTYSNQLQRWQAAMEDSTSHAFDALEPRESAAMSLLYLYHKTVTILLETLLTTSEMVYDKHDSSFEQILSLAEHLIDNSQKTSSIIFFEMGVIGPLWYVLLKCRNLQLRRRALSLLRLSPRREGMWHRQDVIQYAEWKIRIEERGRGALAETDLLPEEARIYYEQMREAVVDGRRVTVIRFRRRRNGCVEYVEDVTNLKITMGNML